MRRLNWNPAIAIVCAIALTTFSSLSPAHSDEPGEGLTRRFEIDYLKSIADHHQKHAGDAVQRILDL